MMASYSFHEDKRLAKFFVSDKQPNKRVKAAVKFCQAVGDTLRRKFILEFSETILQIITETVEEFDIGAQRLNAEAGKEAKRGFFSRFTRDKTKVATPERWGMLYDLMAILLQDASAKVRSGWRRKDFEAFLEQLVDRRHDFGARLRALRLILRFLDAAYALSDSPMVQSHHRRLLVRALDLKAYVSVARNALGVELYTADLPPSAPAGHKPHAALVSTEEPSARQALHCLSIVLEHATAGSNQARFSFWYQLLQHSLLPLLYPDAFHRLFPMTVTGEQGFKPCAPPAVQSVLIKWLLDLIVSKPRFVEVLFATQTSVDVTLEILRQTMHQPALAGATITGVMHWVDGSWPRPRCMRDEKGLRAVLLRFIDMCAEVCAHKEPSRQGSAPHWDALARLAGVEITAAGASSSRRASTTGSSAGMADSTGSGGDGSGSYSGAGGGAGAGAGGGGSNSSGSSGGSGAGGGAVLIPITSKPTFVPASPDEFKPLGTLWRQRVQWCFGVLEAIAKVPSTSVAGSSGGGAGGGAGAASSHTIGGVPAALSPSAQKVAVHLRSAVLAIATAHVANGLRDMVVTPAVFRATVSSWLLAPQGVLVTAAHWAPLYGGFRKWLQTCTGSDAASRGAMVQDLLGVWRAHLLTAMETVLKLLGVVAATPPPPGKLEAATTVAVRLLRLITPNTLTTLDPEPHQLVLRGMLDAVDLWLAAIKNGRVSRTVDPRSGKVAMTFSPVCHVAPDSILAIFGPWLYAVAEENRQPYTPSRALALQALGRVATMHSPKLLSDTHMPRVMMFLSQALRGTKNDLRIQMAVVQHCSTLFAADLPGCTALVPSMIAAADRLMRSSSAVPFMHEARLAAVTMLGTVAALPNHFPELLMPSDGADSRLPFPTVTSPPAALAAAAAKAGMKGDWVRIGDLQPAIVQILNDAAETAASKVVLRQHSLWTLYVVLVDALVYGRSARSPTGGSADADADADASAGAGAGAAATATAGAGAGAGAGASGDGDGDGEGDASHGSTAWIVNKCVSTLLDTATRTPKVGLAVVALQALEALAEHAALVAARCGHGLLCTIVKALARHVELRVGLMFKAANDYVTANANAAKKTVAKPVGGGAVAAAVDKASAAPTVLDLTPTLAQESRRSRATLDCLLAWIMTEPCVLLESPEVSSDVFGALQAAVATELPSDEWRRWAKHVAAGAGRGGKSPGSTGSGSVRGHNRTPTHGGSESVDQRSQRLAKLAEAMSASARIHREHSSNAQRAVNLMRKVGMAALRVIQFTQQHLNKYPVHPFDRCQGGLRWTAAGAEYVNASRVARARLRARSRARTSSQADAGAGAGAGSSRSATPTKVDRNEGSLETDNPSLHLLVGDSTLLSVHGNYNFAGGVAKNAGVRVVCRDPSGVYSWEVQPVSTAADVRRVHQIAAEAERADDVGGPTEVAPKPTAAEAPRSPPPVDAADVEVETVPSTEAVEAVEATGGAGMGAGAGAEDGGDDGVGDDGAGDNANCPKLPSLGVHVLANIMNWVHGAFPDCPEGTVDASVLGGIAATRGATLEYWGEDGARPDERLGLPESVTAPRRPQAPPVAGLIAPAAAVVGNPPGFKIASDGRVQPLPPNSARVQLILRDPRMHRMLLQYLTKEHAEESLLFWDAVEEFKRLPDDERQAAAQKIIDLFIDNKAPSQVNLKSQQFKRINTRFAAGDVAVDLFDEGQAEIVKMINKDNIPRFQRSFGNTVPVALRLYDEIAAMQKLYEEQHQHEQRYVARAAHKHMAAHIHLKPKLIPASLATAVDPCRYLLHQLGYTSLTMGRMTSPLPPSAKLKNHLAAFDAMPALEVAKVAVLYTAGKQRVAEDIIANQATSTEFNTFVAKLGWPIVVTIGGEDDADSDSGASTEEEDDDDDDECSLRLPYFATSTSEVLFHVAPYMMRAAGDRGDLASGREVKWVTNAVARDTVHIVWSDTQQEFDAATFNLNGQSASVYIVVYPMSRAHSGLFRVQVRTTQELRLIGPLREDMVVAEAVLPFLVRRTAINAALVVERQRPRYSSAYRARRNAMKALVAECSESMMDDVQRNAWLFVDRAQLR